MTFIWGRFNDKIKKNSTTLWRCPSFEYDYTFRSDSWRGVFLLTAIEAPSYVCVCELKHAPLNSRRSWDSFEITGHVFFLYGSVLTLEWSNCREAMIRKFVCSEVHVCCVRRLQHAVYLHQWFPKGSLCQRSNIHIKHGRSQCIFSHQGWSFLIGMYFVKWKIVVFVQ